jgi:serine/threonine-protein phosphatase 6 regulatory ankyrin repeat subunit B
LEEAINLNYVKEVERILLQDPSVIKEKTDFGRTALHVAARGSSTGADVAAIVQLLINSGADIEATDERGKTPLHFAVQSGHAETVQLLIDNGANIYARTWFGQTPLQAATFTCSGSHVCNN